MVRKRLLEGCFFFLKTVTETDYIKADGTRFHLKRNATPVSGETGRVVIYSSATRSFGQI